MRQSGNRKVVNVLRNVHQSQVVGALPVGVYSSGGMALRNIGGTDLLPNDFTCVYPHYLLQAHHWRLRW